MKSNNVLRNKNFVLVFLGSMVSNIGATLYSFAVSFYILKISDNNSFLQGTYLAVIGIVYVLVALLGGVIADRYNKAKIMYLSDYAKGFLIVLTTLIMLLFKDNTLTIVLLFISGVLGSIISAIFSPASTALLPLIVKEDSLQQANSYSSVLRSFQSIIGVILASVLYSILSIYTLFFIVGGCYLLSGVSEMFIRYNHIKNADKITVKSTMLDIKDGFSYLFNKKPLWHLVLTILFINFFFAPFDSNFLPYFIETEVANNSFIFDNFLSPESWSAVIGIAFSLGAMISGVIISGIKFKRMITPTKFGIAFISGLFAILTVFYWIFTKEVISLNAFLISTVVISIIMGVCLSFINIPNNTVIQKTTDHNMLGKVSSVMDVTCQGLIPLSSLLAGIVISLFSNTILLAVCSTGFVVMAIIYCVDKEINKMN